MAIDATRSVPAFLPAALAASRVGTWETDFARDRTICDEVTAALFGVDHEAAARGLPLFAFTEAIHRDDVSEFYDKLCAVRERGGLFVVEYRVQPIPGVVRWLLARGRYERDTKTGGVMGRGIVIDTTESKFDVSVESRGFFLTVDQSDEIADEVPLNRAARHAIAARRAIDEDTGADRKALREAVDALLWVVGRALARRTKV